MKVASLHLAAGAALVGCIGPLADLDHEREAAVVTPALTVKSTKLALEYGGAEQTWKVDPTASCEVSAAPEDDIHDDGRLTFVMAANEADPIALGVDIIVSDSYAPYISVGLYAHGKSNWESADDCLLSILDKDYDDRTFSFSIDCRFSSEGEDDVVVAGTVRTKSCFDPTAISFERTSALATDAASLGVDLGKAFVEDPVGFGKTILTLPLLAAGGH